MQVMTLNPSKANLTYHPSDVCRLSTNTLGNSNIFCLQCLNLTKIHYEELHKKKFIIFDTETFINEDSFVIGSTVDVQDPKEIPKNGTESSDWPRAFLKIFRIQARTLIHHKGTSP